MKQLNIRLTKVNRTEHKDWNTSKVRTLCSLLTLNQAEFTDEPLYVVRRRYKQDQYLIYDGNTRHFIAEHGLIVLSRFHLIETDSDLELVRELMQDIYWPGENLAIVTGTLSSRCYYLKQAKRRAA